jgi:4-hydroxy-3-polyprenylbenzoate decarboxylase
MKRFVVGITGASGIILAHRLIASLAENGYEIDLVMSQHALYTATFELGKEYKTAQRFLSSFPEEVQVKIKLHAIHDIGCAIASGSYPVAAMIVVPCSMATLAAIAVGLADNALRRAADVTLKERRPLILVPREAPLSPIHLENLLKMSRLGAIILPPIPAWYTEPQSVADIENFIVGKILDALHIEHHLYKRWKTESK